MLRFSDQHAIVRANNVGGFAQYDFYQSRVAPLFIGDLICELRRGHGFQIDQSALRFRDNLLRDRDDVAVSQFYAHLLSRAQNHHAKVIARSNFRNAANRDESDFGTQNFIAPAEDGSSGAHAKTSWFD